MKTITIDIDQFFGWDIVGRDVHNVILRLLFPSSIASLELLYGVERMWMTLRLVNKHWNKLADNLIDYQLHGALERAYNGKHLQSVIFVLRHGNYKIDDIQLLFTDSLNRRRWEIADAIISNYQQFNGSKHTYKQLMNTKKGELSPNTRILYCIASGPFVGLSIATIVILIKNHDVNCASRNLLIIAIFLELFTAIMLGIGIRQLGKGKRGRWIGALLIPILIWVTLAFSRNNCDSSMYKTMLIVSTSVMISVVVLSWCIFGQFGYAASEYNKNDWKVRVEPKLPDEDPS